MPTLEANCKYTCLHSVGKTVVTLLHRIQSNGLDWTAYVARALLKERPTPCQFPAILIDTPAGVEVRTDASMQFAYTKHSPPCPASSASRAHDLLAALRPEVPQRYLPDAAASDAEVRGRLRSVAWTWGCRRRGDKHIAEQAGCGLGQSPPNAGRVPLAGAADMHSGKYGKDGKSLVTGGPSHGRHGAPSLVRSLVPHSPCSPATLDCPVSTGAGCRLRNHCSPAALTHFGKSGRETHRDVARGPFVMAREPARPLPEPVLSGGS